MIEGLADAGHLRAYASVLGIIILATIAPTIFDRRFDKEFHQRWRDGIAHSFRSVMSVATNGRPPSRENLFGWIGRIWSTLWLIVGIDLL